MIEQEPALTRCPVGREPEGHLDHGDGLLHEPALRPPDSATIHHVIEVPGHIENLALWACGLEVFRQLPASHDWHHDVRKQEVYWVIRLGVLPSLLPRR